MNQVIEEYLASLKAVGKSSPAGMHWQEFHEYLEHHRLPGQDRPPRPLILAASGDSDASKHHRLGEQLYWAHENGCLDGAIAFLRDLPDECWNTCDEHLWNKDSHWSPE